ncbi:hypothetical protein JCM11957_16230 [Caminibacter profundus]
MKPYIWFIVPLIIGGCSISNTSTKVKSFTQCYIKKIPAPFWVCYQSSFQSVGKIHSAQINRLKQEEAFSIGVSDLISKLQAKTKLFLRRLEINDKKTNQILKLVKNFVVINSIQGDSWYSKKENMLYVEVKVDKKDFKRFIFNELKDIDKKTLQMAYDEVF